jgi:hypothetical protein
MPSILSALQALLPVLEPVVLQEFDNVVIPELQKLEQGIGSPDLKVLADAIIAAVKSIADKEIPKI